MKPLSLCLLALLLVFPRLTSAQILLTNPRESSRIVVPPPRRPIPPQYIIREVNLNAAIVDQGAKVQISQIFKNTGSSVLEAQFIFPVPDDAAISDLTLLVDGKELTGKLMKKEDARRIYEEIIRRRRDPALLEYIGQGLFQTSVFPIPAQAERTVEIRYSQLLRKDNGLVDLLLPVGTAKQTTRPIETLNVNVRIEASEAIKTIYSPTHKMTIERPDDKHAVCKLTLQNISTANDVRLMYGMQPGLVGMNLISYRPKADEPGYFLLLADPEVKTEQSQSIEKTIVFVVDRSGSMSGEKIRQAREALKFLLNRLEPGDTFNIVAYDSDIESFRPELQRADSETIQAALGFADGLYSGGSTNIDGALQTAFKMLTDNSRPSYLLFLTDGLPTVGEQNELKIAANARQANKVGARMFNFGVGYDVNSRLLDRLSRDQRGLSVYVRPEESIETHVASLYNKIGSPLLTNLSVKFEFDTPLKEGATDPISRTYPRELTDLFHGEQLVWVGRYTQSGPVKLTLSGTLAGQQQKFTLSTTLLTESKDENAGFVENLWATRRVGEIIDELDLNGQNKELIDELVQLSIRHGILTPYTSFLAEEEVELADRAGNSARTRGNTTRGLSRSSGRSGFAQRAAKKALQSSDQAVPARRESRFATDIDGNERKIETVRNVGQKTFFQKKNRWRDSTVTDEQEKQAVRITQFSQEYFDLAVTHRGQLAKYLVFKEPLLLNLAGKTYQIDPPVEPKNPSLN